MKPTEKKLLTQFGTKRTRGHIIWKASNRLNKFNVNSQWLLSGSWNSLQQEAHNYTCKMRPTSNNNNCPIILSKIYLNNI